MKINHYKFAAPLFISLVLIAFASANLVNFNSETPKDGVTLNDNIIRYGIVVNAPSDRVLSISVSLYDSSYNYISGGENHLTNYSRGEFSSLMDGDYIMVAEALLNNGVNGTSEIRHFTVVDGLSIWYNEPTPESDSLINIFNHPFTIRAGINKQDCSLTTHVLNSTGDEVYVYNISKSDEIETECDWEDGDYSFYTSASCGNLTAKTSTRTLKVRATPPILREFSTPTAIPSNVNTDRSFSFSFVFDLDQLALPARISVHTIRNSTNARQLQASYYITNQTDLPLNVEVKNLSANDRYLVNFTVRDAYNNLVSYQVGAFDVGTTTQETTSSSSSGRRSRGGGIGSYVNPYLNATNETKKNETENKTSFSGNGTSWAPLNEPEEKKSSGLSRITGAFIASLGNKSSTLIVIVIAIIIIYLIYKGIKLNNEPEEEEVGKRRGKKKKTIDPDSE